MEKKTVMIDCERMKYSNTGLYVFCKQLVDAIDKVKGDYNLGLKCFTPKKVVPLFPGISHKVKTPLDKLFFCVGSDVKVFHSTYQGGKYFPKNSKVVLTIHDLNYLYEKGEEKQAKYAKMIQKKIDKADRLVAISNFAKNDVVKYLDTKNKPFDVIYNGCNFYEGELTENPIYKPKKEFLFTVGTVIKKKNFHVLPSLLVGNDYELVISGNSSSYNDVILEEAKKFGVEDRVILTGSISEADKDYYYRNCKAFVFPSIAEGFGLPVIEALHYGKPTFISQRTSLPEIGKDYTYYFDNDFDREKIRAEFNAGMEDFKTRDVQKQIDYAHSYSWENAARQYCEIYSQL